MWCPVVSGTVIDTLGNRYECFMEMNCELTRTGQEAVGWGVGAYWKASEETDNCPECANITDPVFFPAGKGKRGKVVPVLN
jgi:hypothetical protein